MPKRIILQAAMLVAFGAAVTAAVAQAPAGGAPGAAGGGRGGAAAPAAGGAPGAAGPAAAGRGGGARGPTAPAPGVLPALPGVVRAEFPPQNPGLPPGYEAYASQNLQMPSPGHVPFVLEKDIPGWAGQVGVSTGNQQYNIVGTLAGAPGPYFQLLKWWPGSFSRPHYHLEERYIVVVSGTWWGSSASVYDPTKTYPLPAGTVVRDTACTIHWDGSRPEEKQPVVIAIYGMGPSGNVNVDEFGDPINPVNPNDPKAVACAAQAKASSHTFGAPPRPREVVAAAEAAARGGAAAPAGGGRGGAAGAAGGGRGGAAPAAPAGGGR